MEPDITLVLTMEAQLPPTIIIILAPALVIIQTHTVTAREIGNAITDNVLFNMGIISGLLAVVKLVLVLGSRPIRVSIRAISDLVIA